METTIRSISGLWHTVKKMIQGSYFSSREKQLNSLKKSSPLNIIQEESRREYRPTKTFYNE